MSTCDVETPLTLITRRTALEGGVLLLFGVGIGCDEKDEPVSSMDSAEAEGSTVGTTDGPPDPCDAVHTPDGMGWSPIAIEDHPSLAEVGGSVALNLDGLPLIVAQPEAGCFVALSSRCTHEGCTVEFREGRFVCPCHGAAFRTNGDVISGPTPIPLPAYVATEAEGVVWVQTG